MDVARSGPVVRARFEWFDENRDVFKSFVFCCKSRYGLLNNMDRVRSSLVSTNTSYEKVTTIGNGKATSG